MTAKNLYKKVEDILKKNKNFGFVTLPSKILDKSGLPCVTPLKFQLKKLTPAKFYTIFFLVPLKINLSIFISCFPLHTKKFMFRCLDSP